MLPTIKIHRNTHKYQLSAVLIIMLALSSYSWSQEFIEDFSTPVFFYSASEFDGEDRADTGFERTTNSIKATATGDVNGYGIQFVPTGKSEDISVSLEISSESTVSNGPDSGIRVQLRSEVYNNLQDNGFPEQEGNARRVGDVQARMKIRMRNESDGGPIVEGCFRRRSEDGSAGDYAIIDGSPCIQFDAIPQYDTRHSMSVRVDRPASTIVFTFDDESRSIVVPESNLFMPNRDTQDFEIEADSENDVAIVEFFSVTKSGVIDEFSIVGPPQIDAFLDPSDSNYYQDLRIENEKAVLSVSSDSVRRTLNLRWGGDTDYLESTMSLKSESTVTAGSLAAAELGGTLFNSIQDGGTDGSTGDVYSNVGIRLNDDRSTTAIYCAVRSENNDFSVTTRLITAANDDQCGNFETVAELDTEYKMSIELDRAQSQLIFTFGEEQQIYNIDTGVFTTTDNFKAMRSVVENGAGTAITTADDFRTTPSITTPPTNENSGGGCTVITIRPCRYGPALSSAVTYFIYTYISKTIYESLSMWVFSQHLY